MEKIDLAIKKYDGNKKDGIKIINRITEEIEKIKIGSNATDVKKSLEKIEPYAEKIYDKIKNSKKEGTFFCNVYESINIQWGKPNIFSRLKELLTDNEYQQEVDKMSKAYKLKQDKFEALWKNRLRNMLHGLDTDLTDLLNCLVNQLAIIAKAKKDNIKKVDLFTNKYAVLNDPIEELGRYITSDQFMRWYSLKDCRDVLDNAGKFVLDMLNSSVDDLIDELKDEYKDLCKPNGGLVRESNNIKNNFINRGDWLKYIDEDSMKGIIESIEHVLKQTQMMIENMEYES